MTFSEETRRKIGAKSVGRRTMLGKKHSENTKKSYREKRKGRQNSTKITKNQYEEIMTLFDSRPSLTRERIAPSIKKTQRKHYLEGRLELEECIATNGILKNYEREFSIEYADKYPITSAGLYCIITKRTWRNDVIRK